METTQSWQAKTVTYELIQALRCLDDLLLQAAGLLQATLDTKPGGDPYRGLYVDQDEFTRLLAQLPGGPLLNLPNAGAVAALQAAVATIPSLAWLQAAYGLDPFEAMILLLAIAPDLDLRYERIYAFLQDDVSRRRPSIDLALNLLCADPLDKLARRAHFAARAPLLRHGLLRVTPDASDAQTSWPARTLRADLQIVRLALGELVLDERLASFCQLLFPPADSIPISLPPLVVDALRSLAAAAWTSGETLRLHFRGLSGAGQHQAAAVVAQSCGALLLAADLGCLHRPAADLLPVLVREACMLPAILYISRADALLDSAEATNALQEALAAASGIVILAGRDPIPMQAGAGIDLVEVAFDMPGCTERRHAWQAALGARGVAIAADEQLALAARFRLSHVQIEAAVVAACSAGRWQGAMDGSDHAPVSVDKLFAAARAQSGRDLESLARKAKPVYTWADLVLPEDSLAQLRAMCERVVHSERVLGDWGFGRRLSAGKGVTALFAGPSGAGKTMAAEVIANELQLDLYTIDLSSVVSKYIGETEKNLDRVFTAAENANAILFFDEADALFGKRSEVRDSHDRYANIEISYVLQKMEQYDGIAILATNLRGNLDDAFLRRLAFAVFFPFPDTASRKRIWQTLWPDEAPRAVLDIDYLAETFTLSGGNIKNVILAASFLAAADGGTVGMPHVFAAVAAEYQKSGKRIAIGELLTAYQEHCS